MTEKNIVTTITNKLLNKIFYGFNEIIHHIGGSDQVYRHSCMQINGVACPATYCIGARVRALALVTEPVDSIANRW